VRNFTEGEGSMRLDKVNISRRDVDVPLCKVCVHKNEQVNDVRETQWNARQENRKEAHTFLDIEGSCDVI
jgi:hypothetical protein